MVTFTQVLIFLVVGGLAGWLAGLLVRGHGFGVIANVLIGIVGAFIGWLIFSWANVGVMGTLIGDFLVALVGAVILLVVTGLVSNATT